jgi:hypothetical protein
LQTKAAPAPYLPGLIYYRLYVPDGNSRGGVPLPTISYVTDYGSGEADSPLGDSQIDDQSQSLSAPLTPGGSVSEELAQPSGFEPSVSPSQVGQDPQPFRYRGLGANQIDQLQQEGLPQPVADALRTAVTQVGFGGTADNAYVEFLYDLRKGNVVMTAEAPTYRAQHASAANDLGVSDGSEQVRYWSLCATQASRPVDCLRDENVKVDASGDFTVIIAPSCPVNGYDNCLRAGKLSALSSLSADELLYRNTIASPSFANDGGPEACPPTPSEFCGPYKLVVHYVSRP